MRAENQTSLQTVHSNIKADVSIGAPLLGNMEGHPFLWAFEIKRYIKRDVKCPVSIYYYYLLLSLSIGGPLGNLEGIRLTGLFERKG